MSEQKDAALYDAKKDAISASQYDLPPDAGYCREKKESRGKNRFTDKTIIITGGSGVFGSCCAERFASEGAHVALFDINEKAGLEVQQRLQAAHKTRTILFKKVDICNELQVNVAVAETKAAFPSKRIDYLFNNAGYQGDFKKLHEYSVDDFRRVIDINVNGTFIMLKAVSNAMRTQEPSGGSIVQTASMAAHSGPPNMIAYGTSKSAVFHMTRIAAKDLAPYNIRVNSVSPAFIGPGFMWSRQIELQAKANSVYYDKDPKVVKEQMVGCTPLKRYGSTEEVIGPVAFLLSDDASYLTGVDIQITGGIN
mmetsp:Transcript_57535/g.95585  ORF Transcript_57535/g.95585 Transcript_57535/m.95585 type:complete len:309 (-) Transcript_57535:136-1062(-)|eukprot:CAMPEP_0202712036 /NCGR_PEP_ID=MMETSP1385-20130828/31762_1 /ASSEMBLY_ACC=CAM_ASM_000861 /TAXON_ID=933848 /ORGANISM="Elphidium margaritaceum" /LENGTH=308 /DNA_ID=CAMNT_0049371943 /DNA_START=23 /DNA_END=949 /DNA_ORIENTATION=+